MDKDNVLFLIEELKAIFMYSSHKTFLLQKIPLTKHLYFHPYNFYIGKHVTS